MSSVSGLLVPNKFKLYAESITTPGGNTASSVFSANDTNTINLGNAATPANGQVLTATGTNAATWQTPAGASVTPTNVVTFTNKDSSDQSNFSTSSSLWSGSGTNAVSIRAATNPTVGQVLTASSSAVAAWATPAAASVTPTNVVTFTNKDSSDQSNFSTASSLWSGSGTNLISIRAGANPIAGQVLTASSGVLAAWVTPTTVPLPIGTSEYYVTGTTNNNLVAQLIGNFVIPNQVDGPIFAIMDVVGKGTPDQPLGFRCYTTFHNLNGVLTKYGSITDNYSGTAINNPPTFVASGAGINTIAIVASDNGLSTITWRCNVTIRQGP